MTIRELLSRRSWLVLLSCVCLTTNFGCGQQGATKPASGAAVNPAANVEELPIVPRVEFQNWSKFPVGTVITRVRNIGEGSDKVVQTTRYKLASKNDTRVVIEPDVDIDRQGKHEQNEMGTIEYAATFRLPKGMTEAMFAQPDPKAESLGTESIEMLGKTIQAEVFTWKTSAEAGPVTNKLWMSNEIPGRVIKHQTEVVGNKSEEVVTSLSIPE